MIAPRSNGTASGTLGWAVEPASSHILLHTVEPCGPPIRRPCGRLDTMPPVRCWRYWGWRNADTKWALRTQLLAQPAQVKKRKKMGSVEHSKAGRRSQGAGQVHPSGTATQGASGSYAVADHTTDYKRCLVLSRNPEASDGASDVGRSSGKRHPHFTKHNDASSREEKLHVQLECSRLLSTSPTRVNRR